MLREGWEQEGEAAGCSLCPLAAPRHWPRSLGRAVTDPIPSEGWRGVARAMSHHHA